MQELTCSGCFHSIDDHADGPVYKEACLLCDCPCYSRWIIKGYEDDGRAFVDPLEAVG